MNYREFGRTGRRVSEISFGAWAIGGTWGEVKDEESLAALRQAIDLGVNFIDTADVYGDGHSERLIGEVLRESSQNIFVATKIGRRSSPHTADSYNKANLTAFVERSLMNLGVEILDLVQLHCPPTEVYYRPEVFQIMDDLITAGKIRYYGVSVEKVEEGLKAIEYPGVQSVQIVFNLFRHRPAEKLFQECRAKRVAVIARVPLASGLLTGKMNIRSTFAADDHRNFNRHGEAFDKGETFSGVDFEKGLTAVAELKEILPKSETLAQFALRWILMFPEVSCVIPGAKNISQVEQNVAVTNLPPLTENETAKVKAIYERYIKQDVHQRW
jgi:aryl-alcohol dehydrogenase-like predicted oxidoreductase